MLFLHTKRFRSYETASCRNCSLDLFFKHVFFVRLIAKATSKPQLKLLKSTSKSFSTETMFCVDVCKNTKLNCIYLHNQRNEIWREMPDTFGLIWKHTCTYVLPLHIWWRFYFLCPWKHVIGH